MSDNMIGNRYKALRHIGQGGMSDVILAHDTILDRDVAIKFLKSDLLNDPVAIMRFKQEADASTALSHPNIVDIYDIGEYHHNHYIVMEYIKGITLKQLIAKRGHLYKEEAVVIMKQLVSATIEAHKRGIIHRDIKPQNVLIKHDGTVKMVDFGIAVAENSLQLTQNDAIMGSVHYLAPEVCKGEQASEKSDIYALGIVFYELLTGDVPYKAEQPVQVAIMHINNEIPEIRKINPSIPQSIENIIIRATAKNKNLRYQSAQDMLDDLKTCLNPERQNDKQNKVTQLTKAPQSETTTPKKKRRSVHLMWIIMPLLTLFLVAVVYIVFLIATRFTKPQPVLTVPDIVGMDVAGAKIALENVGLTLDSEHIVYELTNDTPKGKIAYVSPAVNSQVEENTSVQIVVSSGISEKIGDYVGRRLSEVKKELSTYQNLNIIAEAVEDNSVVPGVIIRQELLEPNATFNPEVTTDIKFIYSQYKTFEIPTDIIGMKIEDATKRLQSMGADVMLSPLDTSNLSEEEKKALKEGVVIQTTPAAGNQYTQVDESMVVIYYYEDESH